MATVWEIVKVWWGYMSCALWTFMGLGVLIFNPTAIHQRNLYFILAGVSLLFAFLQTIYIQHRQIASTNAKLREIEEARPRITLRNPYTEMVNVNHDGVVVFVANVLRVRLENTSQNHYPNNEAKGVIAKISFYDSSHNLLISDLDGRWTDSTQPVGPHWQSVVPLLETDFRIGAKHDLDIAFSETTYINCIQELVAINNDNFRFQRWRKPEHILAGERFVAKIRISAVWVSTEFSVEFWGMPHGEIGFRLV